MKKLCRVASKIQIRNRIERMDTISCDFAHSQLRREKVEELENQKQKPRMNYNEHIHKSILKAFYGQVLSFEIVH